MNDNCKRDLFDLGTLVTKLKSSIGYYALKEISEFENNYYKINTSIDSLIEKINHQCSLNLYHLNFYSNSDDIILSGKSADEFSSYFDEAYKPLEKEIKLILGSQNQESESESHLEEINNVIEFNTQYIVVQNSQGVIINSDDNTITVQDSFSEIYSKLESLETNKTEIEEKVKEIQNELEKENLDKSKIQSSMEWLKRNANWTIPTLTQIITAVIAGSG